MAASTLNLLGLGLAAVPAALGSYSSSSSLALNRVRVMPPEKWTRRSRSALCFVLMATGEARCCTAAATMSADHGLTIRSLLSQCASLPVAGKPSWPLAVRASGCQEPLSMRMRTKPRLFAPQLCQCQCLK